jgi:methylmalonyl-CoA/ethylmalonyl-CoA epimerase
MKRYEGLLGIDSWIVFEVNLSLVRMTYHGKPSQHSFKATFTILGSLMIELLQPLEGRGIYRDFLDKHEEGLHHLGHVRVDNIDEAVRKLRCPKLNR